MDEPLTIDIVHSPCTGIPAPNLVCPSRNWREVTSRFGREDGAELGSYGWMEMDLGDGRDDLVA